MFYGNTIILVNPEHKNFRFKSYQEKKVVFELLGAGEYKITGTQFVLDNVFY